LFHRPKKRKISLNARQLVLFWCEATDMNLHSSGNNTLHLYDKLQLGAARCRVLEGLAAAARQRRRRGEDSAAPNKKPRRIATAGFFHAMPSGIT
jgi:hypothetical protein